MGGGGTVQAGTMRFIIISKCSFYNTRVDIFRGQVVISTPDGWEWGGGDSTGRDNALHHHFQMQLLQTRVDTYSVGQIVISAPVGWEGGGGGDSTGKDNVFHQHFQMQLLQITMDMIRVAGSNLCPCWLGTDRVGGTVQAGTIRFIIISKCSFCKQEWT
jgi:hypothetical protein